MKATFTLLTFLGAVAFAQAQMVPVTFAVDMNGVDEFNPDSDTLRVAGDLQSWTPRDPSGENILTDEDENGVYSVTLDLAPGAYEFKYVINNWDGSGGFNEASGTTPVVSADTTCFNDGNNRPLTVTADGADLPVYEYNSCEESELGASSARDFAELRGVTVGPNPATDYATVALPAGGTYAIRVMSANGRVMSEVADFTQASYEIAGADFPAGLYLVEVVDAARGERAVMRVSFQ